EFIVAENGSIDATASVPESVSSGFHTLHIYGTGVDGGLVDIYQFVTIDQEIGMSEDGATAENDINVVGRVDAPTNNQLSTLSPLIGRSVFGDQASAVAGQSTINGELSRVSGAVSKHAPKNSLILLIAGITLLCLTITILILVCARKQWAKPSG
ncbi:hypothetical protein H7200_00840, partial [Candidatus Saccharibacteria bacterium]|nr:hypothetical protein [Candidatus Saccharibacteria bacterium]